MLAEINRDQHLTMLVLVVILVLIGAQLLCFTRRQVSAAQAQRSRDRMTSLLQSVADDYLCLISVDLNTQQEELFRLRESCGLEDWTGGDADYTHGMQKFARQFVCPQDRDRFLRTARLDTLLPLLERQRSFISNMMPSSAASSSICKASSSWTAAIPGSPACCPASATSRS